jgi:hypothetical protein
MDGEFCLSLHYCVIFTDPTRSKTAAHKATVISSPPKFAWGINDTTTLYDVMEDIYKKADHTGIATDTQFYRDIWPVLLNGCAMAWVNSRANDGHGMICYLINLGHS